jgi:hypothetical protein
MQSKLCNGTKQNKHKIVEKYIASKHSLVSKCIRMHVFVRGCLCLCVFVALLLL